MLAPAGPSAEHPPCTCSTGDFPFRQSRRTRGNEHVHSCDASSIRPAHGSTAISTGESLVFLTGLRDKALGARDPSVFQGMGWNGCVWEMMDLT
jgi:hypothetical protein